MKRHHRWTLYAALLVAAGCDNPVDVPPPPAVDSVIVSSVRLTFQPGDSLTLRAIVLAADGTELSGRSVAWSSTDTMVASVTPAGTLRAKGPGSARVQAAVEGKVGSADVVVEPHAVASVSIEPGVLLLDEGDAGQLSAILRAANGEVLSGRPVTFESLDPDVALVTASGSVLAIRPGTARVRAESQGKVGLAVVSVASRPRQDTLRIVVVSPNPATLVVGQGYLFTADVRTPSGEQVPGARIDAWWSSDPAVATVSSTGIVRAVAAGTARIHASSGTFSGSATVVVKAAPSPSGSYRQVWRAGEVSQALDTVDFVDADGSKVRAHVYLKSANLTLKLEEGRYEQFFVADVVAVADGKPLGIRTWNQHGQIWLQWPDGSLVLAPENGAAPSFSVHPRPSDGALVVKQSILGRTVVEYLYLKTQ